MLTMTNVNGIRKLYFEEGKTISAICRQTGFDRKTIRGYVGKDDFNAKISSANKKASFLKLEPYKEDIDKWLTEDKKAKKKQRHTAKRVFDRLGDKYNKEFDCSYRTVTYRDNIIANSINIY